MIHDNRNNSLENRIDHGCIKHDECQLKLRCRIISNQGITTDVTSGTNQNEQHHTLLWFDLEDGKRASFVLKNIKSPPGDERKEASADNDVLLGKDEIHNSYHYTTLVEIVDKPAILVIDSCQVTSNDLSDSTEKFSFMFGGIDMISNCRTIEIYVIDIQAKETYVTTSRGVKLSSEPNGNAWFHIVASRPGGPQHVTAVKLKLILTNTNPKPKFFTELTCTSSVNSSKSSHSSNGSKNESTDEESDRASPKCEFQEEGRISFGMDNTHDEEDSDTNPVKISSLKVKGRLFAASTQEKNKNDTNMSQPSIISPNYYLAQQEQKIKAINPSSIASSHNATADNAIHSSVALGMALMLKSLEENVLHSIKTLESKISNVEHQVQNLNQYVSTSYQMILHQQIQLIQAQNAFISRELREMKNTLKSDMNSCGITDDSKFSMKDIKEKMNDASDSVSPASEDKVDETVPSTKLGVNRNELKEIKEDVDTSISILSRETDTYTEEGVLR